MNEWTIRKATVKDTEAVTELRIELLTEVGDVNDQNRSYVSEANRKYFMKKLADGSFSAWIAEVKGKVVAISGLVYFERPPHGENMSGSEAYIMNMYTKPDYRGHGIAGAILEQCISHCRSEGIGRIWLHSSDDGYHLYKKMGFTDKESEMELLL